MAGNRRIFLTRCGTAGVASVGVSMPGIWRSAVNAAGLLGMPNTKGRVLVVVEMPQAQD